MEKIPLVNLERQYRSIQNEIDAGIKRVISTTAFINGPDVKTFEVEFASFCRAERCVAVANGTDAITIALRMLDVRPGDSVLVPSHTFIATAEGVTLAGAVPAFVDVDEKTFLIDPKDLERRIKTLRDSGHIVKAIIAVHLYGQPCDMKALQDICGKYDLKLIEDSAQAHGAEYHGRRVSNFGDVATFSFYPGKNLGAYGDGGAIVTNNHDLALKMRMYANHGRQEKYTHLIEGTNSRLDTLQAAILRAKLKHLEQWNERRRKVASLYDQLLGSINGLSIPLTHASNRHVYHLYVVRAAGRDELQQHLKVAGIETGIHYPIPLHLQPAYKYLGYKLGDFPVSERVANDILSLPIDGDITDEEVFYIAETIKKFY